MMSARGGPGYGGGILRAKVLTVVLALAASVIPVEYGAGGAGGAAAATGAPATYARYFLSTDTLNSPATQAKRWPLLIGQSDQAAGARKVETADPSHVRTVFYADPLFLRQSDPDGVTTAVPYSQAVADHPEWFLLDAAGKRIPATRNRNKDFAADIGNVAYQQAAASFLLGKIDMAGWDGVFLDDTNPTPAYTFSVRPAKYPTDASWQAAELAFVTTVCGTVRAAGKLCYLNLGQRNTTWAQDVARRSTGPMTEFFVAMNPSLGMPALATVENGFWTEQLQWAKWAEANTTQQIVHASTNSAAAITYALASYLLVSSGTGAFAANRDYGSSLEGLTYPKSLTDAASFGAPTGPYVQDASGVYYRTFAHGTVVVNPHNTSRRFRGVTYAAASGVVTPTG